MASNHDPQTSEKLPAKSEKALMVCRSELWAADDALRADLLRLRLELELHRVELLKEENAELQRANEELQNSLTEYAGFYHQALVGCLRVNDDHVITRANKAAAEILHVPEASLKDRSILHHLDEGDCQAYFLAVQSSRRPGTMAQLELSLIRADGLPCRVQARLVPCHDEKGILSGWLFIFFDVTGQWSSSIKQRDQIDRLNVMLRASEEAPAETTTESLRHSELKFRSLFESMVQGVVYQNQKGEIVDANPAAEKILGMSLERLKGMSLSDSVWQAIREDGSEFRKNEWPLVYAIENRKPVWNVIAGILNPVERNYRWLRISCIPVPQLAPEQPYVVFTTLSDVTRLKLGEDELKRGRDELETKVLERTSELIKANEQLKDEIKQRIQAEKAARRGEKLFRSVLETLPVGVITIDKQGTIISMNPAARKIWGGTRLVGISKFNEYKGWWLDTGKRIQPEEWAAARAILKGETSLEELIKIECFDGTRKVILNWAAPIIDSNRNTKGAIVFNQDVSERVKAEHALRQSETELRALSLKLLTAQEEERKRIARELHDSTSSSLAGIKYYLEAFISDPEAIPPCKAKLQQLLSFLEVAIQELRRIMTDLRPSVLDDLGLLATIDWFCRRLCSVYQSIHIEEEITVNENDVPEPLKIVIFRILQEAVNNAAKYSHAKRVNISLVRSHSVLQLTIADEGVGFDINGLRSTNLHGRGWGIIGMKERTELTGGTFSIESGSGCGTRVCARWLFDA